MYSGEELAQSQDFPFFNKEKNPHESGQLLGCHHARYRNATDAIFVALERSHAGNLIHLLFSQIRDRGRRQSGREVGIFQREREREDEIGCRSHPLYARVQIPPTLR